MDGVENIFFFVSERTKRNIIEIDVEGPVGVKQKHFFYLMRDKSKQESIR